MLSNLLWLFGNLRLKSFLLVLCRLKGSRSCGRTSSLINFFLSLSWDDSLGLDSLNWLFLICSSCGGTSFTLLFLFIFEYLSAFSIDSGTYLWLHLHLLRLKLLLKSKLLSLFFYLEVTFLVLKKFVKVSWLLLLGCFLGRATVVSLLVGGQNFLRS